MTRNNVLDIIKKKLEDRKELSLAEIDYILDELNMHIADIKKELMKLKKSL